LRSKPNGALPTWAEIQHDGCPAQGRPFFSYDQVSGVFRRLSQKIVSKPLPSSSSVSFLTRRPQLPRCRLRQREAVCLTLRRRPYDSQRCCNYLRVCWKGGKGVPERRARLGPGKVSSIGVHL